MMAGDTYPAADVAIAEAWLAFGAETRELAQADDLVWREPWSDNRAARLLRFPRSAARHPLTTVRTAIGAAKLLPAVRQAVPWYVWPVLAIAAVVKCFPLDFGTDEALFAQAGKPAPCMCPRHYSPRGN